MINKLKSLKVAKLKYEIDYGRDDSKLTEWIMIRMVFICLSRVAFTTKNNSRSISSNPLQTPTFLEGAF